MFVALLHTPYLWKEVAIALVSFSLVFLPSDRSLKIGNEDDNIYREDTYLF